VIGRVKGMLSALVLASVWLVGCRRGPIGSRCTGALECEPGAELCLKPSGSAAGTCSKRCRNDAMCGPLARCQSVKMTRSGGVYGAGTSSDEAWCVPR